MTTIANTYNEIFNELWARSKESNHCRIQDRAVVGAFLLKMSDENNLLYIGYGHQYGEPFTWIPVSNDGQNEYVMIPTKDNTGSVKHIVEKLSVPALDIDMDGEPVIPKAERYIKWTSVATELDFYDA